MAILVYLIMSGVLGWGILRAITGHPLLLIVGLITYFVAFGAIGCLPKSTH
jgi:hypothetical protein